MNPETLGEPKQILQAAFSADAGGRLAEAEHLCTKLLEVEPGNAPAMLLRGIVTAKSGRPAEAIERLNDVLREDGENPIALYWLSMLVREAGRIDEATGYAERAVQARPGDAELLFSLGLAYLAQSRSHDAIASLEKACEIRPHHPPYLYGLSGALESFGRSWDAIRALREATALAPNLRGLVRLAHLLLMEGHPEEALAASRQAVGMKPDSAQAHLFVAEALTALDRDEEAAPEYAKAYGLEPSLKESYSVQRATRLQGLGKLERAAEQFQAIIEEAPANGHAYFGLVTSKQIGESDLPLVGQMEAVLQDRSLSPSDRVDLHYALGKALDDLGDYERAMGHYDQANATILAGRHPSQHFNREMFSRRVDAQISCFTKEFVAEARKDGSKSDVPIFIVGMMRSGTTLADQILSSHPDVGAAGEQGYWSFNELKVVNFPQRSIDPVDLVLFAKAYLELVQEIVPAKRRVTDKNPANSMVLGLIHCALPNARIIHMQRNPVDTCLSVYTTSVRTAPDFANDRDNIVYAYRQYRRLTDHWRSVLPADRFLDLRYEDLVSDQEATTRKMLEFCGLEWNETCLFPERNETRVGTPSFWQVRRPVYRTSMERWRRYEPWLGVFKELLEDENRSTVEANEQHP